MIGSSVAVVAQRASVGGLVAAWWGVLGLMALFLNASLRLGGWAWDAIEHGLVHWQWAVLVAWMLFNAYYEAYKAFHRTFCPRAAVRAMHLARHPSVLLGILAPLYCMGLVHARRRRLIGSWILAGSIVTFIIFVRRLDQPWRGIVDAGVVLPLAYGALNLAYWWLRALRGRPPAIDPELPDHVQAART